MNYHIAVIPGDGIGPEIVAEAKKVLNKVADTYGHTFEYEELLMGGCSIDAYGEPLTDETLERARKSDSILLGAVDDVHGLGTQTQGAAGSIHGHVAAAHNGHLFAGADGGLAGGQVGLHQVGAGQELVGRVHAPV